MAHPNIDLMGAVYPTVPAVVLPKEGGGTATFTDTSDASASASDIKSGSSAYVNGSLVEGSLVTQTYYTGSGNPSSSLGANGDLYLKVV